MKIIKNLFDSFAILLVLVLTSKAGAQDPYIPTFTELAPGVWSGVREDNPRFPVMGTATFVISDKGVVVYDGGGSATMAERIIAKIRSLTDLPVTHVVISHWHGDHNFGIFRYLEEYANVQVVAHTFTQAVFEGTRIDYIDAYPEQIPNFKPQIEKGLEEGTLLGGDPMPDVMRGVYERILEDADMIHADNQRAKVTHATLTFDEKLTIRSGARRIELLYLGDGNTAGDIVMWLPEEKIVATGDIVVHPVPYAFNMPPKKWGATLRRIQGLGYETLVPGHGDLQRDQSYVDLLIETADSVVVQRDALVAQNIEEADAIAQIDFSDFESRYIGDSDYLAVYFDAWFKKPMAAAAFKELKNIPMVTPNREE
ncbi:MAG: MBL fold metallo-hydrolase [Kordiimonadaceae bacterium]|nr:MBL fold metallo-hydrolase [Kordiimonadaceae bacterium]MBO6568514.1 MBL fold metallo-hydrolase [Kordiimonadaceae bacterium]MBO6963757.1 MBL fold metallo-hydrolase [Kordiimonadaceae bacterium]